MAKKAKKTKKLTAQQRKVCQLWVINFNLADAWLGAGYKTKTRKTAEVNASRFMLSNAMAQKYIVKLLAKQTKRAEKSADDVVREMELLGFSNIQDFVGTSGKGEFVFKDWSGISREKLAAVESVKVTRTTRTSKEGEDYTTTNISFKLHDKLKALEDLGKRHGLFADKHVLVDARRYSPEECEKIRGVLAGRFD